MGQALASAAARRVAIAPEFLLPALETGQGRYRVAHLVERMRPGSGECCIIRTNSRDAGVRQMPESKQVSQDEFRSGVGAARY